MCRSRKCISKRNSRRNCEMHEAPSADAVWASNKHAAPANGANTSILASAVQMHRRIILAWNQRDFGALPHAYGFNGAHSCARVMCGELYLHKPPWKAVLVFEAEAVWNASLQRLGACCYRH